MYFFADASSEAVLESGMRAVLGTPVFEFPTRYGSGPDDYLSKGAAVCAKYRSKDGSADRLKP